MPPIWVAISRAVSLTSHCSILTFLLRLCKGLWYTGFMKTTKRIILASSSPRRIEMMKNNGYTPEIMPADVDESIHINMSCEAAAMSLAYKKASHVAEIVRSKKFESTSCKIKSDGAVIIAADTIVVYNNEIIGKPASEDEAFDVLSRLRNDSHYVMTGVTVIDTAANIKHCFCDTTAVYFNDYSDAELLEYVKTAEPYDKAGGYAIQGTFAKYIDRIEGDYDNVVGFPWYRIEPYLQAP